MTTLPFPPRSDQQAVGSHHSSHSGNRHQPQQTRSVLSDIALVIIIMTVATLLTSCTSARTPVPDGATFSYHRDPAIDQIQRIVVMPFHNAEQVGSSAATLNQAMSAAWRELGAFEVINATLAERDQLVPVDAFRTRNIDSDILRRVFEAFKADAVLIGRIEVFDPYDPVTIGVQAALVSCLNGAIVWTGGGHFDGARKQIQDDIEHWHQHAVGSDYQSVAGWRAALHSPKLFARYVSDRLAVTALDDWKQRLEPPRQRHSHRR